MIKISNDVVFSFSHSSYIQKEVRAINQSLVYSWYEQYKNGIYRYALSITKDPHLAEDVLHDTFVKLLSGGIRCVSGKEQAWLYRIARNLCYDHLRKAKREQLFMDPPAQAENQLEYIELISPLSPMEQEIVTLKIIGGLSHKEIGSVLGITPSAAQKRYERAINTLRSKED